jgi:RNA polymerase sigma-70 factor (ECF subfamily)
LYGAVRHLALNHLRHERVVARTIGGGQGQARLPDMPPRGVEQVQATTIGAPPVDQHAAVEAGELDDAVVRALAELPERRRIAMTLRWKQDMSPLEIARVLGTTPEAVRVLLTRARADLAALLDRARR